MKAYKKAVLTVDEFILNADIAASTQDINTQGGSDNLSAGIEFEISANGYDEI